jgi:hypothetical protein
MVLVEAARLASCSGSRGDPPLTAAERPTHDALVQRRDLSVLRMGVLGLLSLLVACDEPKPTAPARPATDTKDAATKVADAKAPDAKAVDSKSADSKSADSKSADSKAPVETDTTAPPEPVRPTEATPPPTPGKPTGPVVRPVDNGLPPGEVPVDDEEPELELDLTYETIGGVHVDMPAAEVIAKLGKPTKRSKVIVENATGDYVQAWHYEGLAIGMRADTRKGAQTVASIHATAACKLPASWGLAIGSTRAEVEKVYAACLVPDLSGPNELLTGGVYAGVTFGFTDGKVTSIFMGGGE